MLIWIWPNWPKLIGLTWLGIFIQTSWICLWILYLTLDLIHYSSPPNLPQKVWTGPRTHFFKVSAKKRPPSLHCLQNVGHSQVTFFWCPRQKVSRGPYHSFPGAGRHTCLSAGCNLLEPCKAISSLSKSAQKPRTALLLLRALVVLNLLKLCPILARRILPGRWLR